MGSLALNGQGIEAAANRQPTYKETIMRVEPIDLAAELRRIAREMDEAGSSPTRQYVLSKYDSDLLRDAAKEIEGLNSDIDDLEAEVDSHVSSIAKHL